MSSNNNDQSRKQSHDKDLHNKHGKVEKDEKVEKVEVILMERQHDPDIDASRISGIDKWMIVLIIAIIFFILVLPFTFKVTNKATSYVRLNTVNIYGVPTITGVIIHTIIFGLIIRLLMH